MDALGRLAGGVAHDFNNLLTVIKGHGDLLLGRLQPADSLHTSGLQIVKAADRAASLTRQLLAFCRMQLLQPKVVDLNALVSEMCSLLRRLVREDIAFTFQAGESLGRVKADPGQIEQVIVNLTVNACDAMPESGRGRDILAPPVRRTATVLIAEDEEGVRELASEFVSSAGYTVLTAKDGQEALEIAERSPGSIHLLITDVVMPKMRGPELAKRLKALQPYLRIVYMSGYLEYNSGNGQFLEEGFFLQKPFSRNTLVRTVHEALSHELEALSV